MEDISRERLFELIWSEPATAVAKRLGISDVALGKLCRRLQVPKPPRGYWARMHAGQTVQRPPLPAFVEESTKEQSAKGSAAGKAGGRRRHQARGLKLSARKRELFDHGVRHLRPNGATADDFTISGGGLTSIDPDFAAAMLMAVGQHYRRWCLPDDAGMRAEQGLEGVAGRLIEGLLPLARERVIVFSPPDPKEEVQRHGNRDQHAVVRFTPELVRTIARLAQLVRNEELAFVAHGLGSANQFWRVRWAYHPNRGVYGQTRLCVSASEAWVRYDGPNWFGDPYVLDTAAVPLEQIAPIELLGECEVVATAAQAQTHHGPYSDRLRALQRAEQAFDIAENAWLNVGQELDPAPLVQAVALWWTEDQLDALQRVRDGLEEIGPWIDNWEQALEREREALCREILGVRVGDSVSVDGPAGRKRLRLEGMHLVFPEDDGDLRFFLYGTRYRKDGLPGKRSETATITVPWAESDR